MGNKNKNIDDVNFNIKLILFVMIISIIIGFSADLHPSSNHAGIAALIIPILITVGTIIVYLLSKLFMKEYNWIFTFLGVFLNLVFAIIWYISNM